MKPRILLIDDDEDFRALYSGYLRKQLSWEVLDAGSGEEGLKLLDSSFDAVVLDEQMPGMKGTQVLQEIKRRTDVNPVCVIMLSATNDPKTIVGAFRHKPNSYLLKQETPPRELGRILAMEIDSTNRKSATANRSKIRPIRVFLCHSHVDKAAVRELYFRLKGDFIEPWLDSENIVPGRDWELEILRAVRASDIVAVCLSRQVSRRGYLQKEIRVVLEEADRQPPGAIFMIPLLLEPCDVPERLQSVQWINFFEEGSYDRFLRAIEDKARDLIAGGGA